MATLQERLTEVQTAISKIVTSGQSYTMGQRQLQRADLKSLQELEKSLMRQINRQSVGGMVVQGVVIAEGQ